MGCNFEYSDEIQLAYDSLDKSTQESIKNWKRANAYEIKKQVDFEIHQENSSEMLNIKGLEVIVISFKTSDDALLGPVTLYMDKNTKEIIGYAPRK